MDGEIAAPLNFISDSIIVNQIPKIDNVQLINNSPDENNRQEINQNEVVVQEIDNYEEVRYVSL